LAKLFEAVPTLDLQKSQAELQHEHTADLAHRLDKNVLDFIAGHSALSTTLKALIQQRQPFPKERFEELKKAFPCIIAGIREFADYIPLAPGLVDIVIIDEASQVSIAQAFPALLRAKQVVVLGDEQQFANVKTSNASRAVNQEYMYELEEVFRDHFNVDSEKMARMRSFDVRTSILRFFDLVKHFDVMLKKHFRGYAELISFSSKYFYDGQLQAIRIRSKPVSEVLQFSVLDEDRMPMITHRNANEAECTYIHEMLEELLKIDEPPTVGVITPFREQQKLISRKLLFDSALGDDFRERLNLKVKEVMTYIFQVDGHGVIA
jgi:superfamily I DNA and/or RNA helicase